ncbi:MAG: UDP-N-acetylmuramoyl-tripeptide--D-alanyl-D-alanine ligase [Ignavibacteriales bacterium]|nr:MAG: UDP-N-acetylmuramoyl-tripeptide--D-alanyl-D-alanine ligase [Ignavibacteriales bacterium]
MGKIKITIEDLFNISSAVIYNPDAFKPVSNVEIDSRRVKKGSLFVAIKGEKYDGHDFILDALKKGANAVIIDSRKLKKFSFLEIPVVAVNNTTRVYGELAKIWRNKISAKVISITGSNGKTTVKEMMASLLSEKYNVVKTAANNNNHIGVPLTILGTDEKCEALVLEQGTNHFNEIEYSANISRPDYALITNIGDTHLEYFKNREGVYKEKSALLDITEMHGGTVFLNMDDPIIRKHSKNYWNKITYGFNGSVNVKGKILDYTNDGRTKIKISYKGKKIETILPVYGESNAKNFLAASAVVLKLGLTGNEIINGTKNIKPVHGRLEVKKFKDAVVIDDTYNSSPASVESAVDLIKKIKTHKRKIIVLGDMLELGKQSEKLHKDLAKLFSSDKNLFVLTTGNMMKHLNKALRKKKVKSIHFHIREALSLYLQYEEIENSVILVKGSRGMKMEEFVNTLEKRFE